MTRVSVQILSFLTAIVTVLLLVMGALVTSTGSGLAVPDWPLSYGSLFPEMVGGVFFEHGHRLVAGAVLILTTTLLVFSRYFSTDLNFRRLVATMWVLVVAQALLGGLTVLLRLPPSVSIAHACLAQVFFSCTVLAAFMAGLSRSGFSEFQAPRQLSFRFRWLPVLFFAQLMMGATMRHWGAGLAVPDFPLVFGGIFPPYLSPEILVHLGHRFFAFLLLGWVILLTVKTMSLEASLKLKTLVGVLLTVLLAQATLGALILWTHRHIAITTIHLVFGAIAFSLSVVLGKIGWNHE